MNICDFLKSDELSKNFYTTEGDKVRLIKPIDSPFCGYIFDKKVLITSLDGLILDSRLSLSGMNIKSLKGLVMCSGDLSLEDCNIMYMEDFKIDYNLSLKSKPTIEDIDLTGPSNILYDLLYWNNFHGPKYSKYENVAPFFYCNVDDGVLINREILTRSEDIEDYLLKLNSIYFHISKIKKLNLKL